jgi:hypothetical protein
MASATITASEASTIRPTQDDVLAVAAFITGVNVQVLEFLHSVTRSIRK